MPTGVSLRRNAAGAVAAAGLCWLVLAVNSLGDDAQRGAARFLRDTATAPVAIPRDSISGGGGLDLVDMYQCMCASNDDISQWVRWWLVAVIVGGLPTAVLLHSPDRARHHA